MIKDIVRGDGCKSEVDKLNNKITKLNTQIQVQDSINYVLNQKVTAYKATVNEFQSIDDLNQKTIESLNQRINKYKRQRNAFKIFATALLFGLIVK